MYCPNCAAPVNGMKFCRQCGANVSLVPQALEGQLPKAADKQETDWGMDWGWGKHRHGKASSLESASREFFTGLGFLFVSLAIWQFFPGGKTWWFWMLIPAFAAMGKGVGQYLRLRSEQQTLQSHQQPLRVTAPPTPQFSAPTTSELKLPQPAQAIPASITEHTTKHLDAARPREPEQN
jgi:hypothetical protein